MHVLMSKRKIIFCFPYAGGTAGFFDFFDEVFPENFQMEKLEYSGHGKRMKEPLYESFEEMAADLYSSIEKTLMNHPDAEYGLMGYSMGSISVFSVLQYIIEKGSCRKPKHIFLAAHQPQPIIEFRNIPENKVDEWVKQRTVLFGGVPEKLLNNQSFWRVYLPVYTADYKLIAGYDFDAVNFTTDIPVTVFYSAEDTPYEDMLGWKQFFVGDCEYVEYDGPHFFINKYYREIAEIICRRMEK